MQWSCWASLRWSRGRTLLSFGKRETSWLLQTAHGWYRYGTMGKKTGTLPEIAPLFQSDFCLLLLFFEFFVLFFPRCAALLCIPRWPLPLHGDGIHARRWLGELDEQLWRPREVGALLHGRGSAGSGWNPRHGLHSQVTKKFYHFYPTRRFCLLVFTVAAVRHVGVNSFQMENAAFTSVRFSTRLMWTAVLCFQVVRPSQSCQCDFSNIPLNLLRLYAKTKGWPWFYWSEVKGRGLNAFCSHPSVHFGDGEQKGETVTTFHVWPDAESVTLTLRSNLESVVIVSVLPSSISWLWL